MFRKLHIAYANAVSDPFYIPGDQIQSKYENLEIIFIFESFLHHNF